MADIELVIKIPKEDYKAIKNMQIVGDMTIPNVFNAIRNGTSIPNDATYGDIFELLLDNRIDTDIKFDENFNGGIRKRLRFDKTWWNAPYKAESEIRAYDGYTDAFVSDDGKAYRYSDGKMMEVQDET